MVNFITRMIEERADNSLEEGQALYRKYFISTKIYKSYKAGVDEKLTADGYAEVIVKK